MTFKIPELEDLPESLKEKAEKDPAFLKLVQKMTLDQYAVSLLGMINHLMRQLLETKTIDADRLHQICRLLGEYKLEYEQVNAARNGLESKGV